MTLLCPCCLSGTLRNKCLRQLPPVDKCEPGDLRKALPEAANLGLAFSPSWRKLGCPVGPLFSPASIQLSWEALRADSSRSL